MRISRALAASLLAALTSGCAAFSSDRGMGLVSQISEGELRKSVNVIRTEDQAAATTAAVADLLRRPLTVDTAVQIALLNNRALQAAYNELGLAEVELIRGSTPPNPTLSVERISGAAEIEIEKRIVANILALATLPARASIAKDRFYQAQLRATEETLRTAAETRRTFYRAVAQRELSIFLARSREAAEVAVKLAKRLGESGGMNKLDQAREQVFYAELTARVGTARQRADTERERLIRILGLWGQQTIFQLPGNLAALPRRPLTSAGIEIEAVRRRVDLQVARIEVTALSRSYGLSATTRFINLLEVSGIQKDTRERMTGERVRDRGFELEFQIPIFDGGEARVRQASETYLQAVNKLVDRAVQVRSQAREVYRTYRSAFDIASHYQREVLPLRKIISDETQLRYNAMLIDVFALLVEARQRIDALAASIEARRDFWLASVDLSTAVVGGGVAGASESAGSAPMANAEQGGH